MPVFRNRTVINIARNIKAFLNFEAGVTRGDAPKFRPREQETGQQEQRHSVANVSRQLAIKDAEIAKLRTKLTLGGDVLEADGISPENVIWMFCTGRSGSTWLSFMMGEIDGHEAWREPKISHLFGNFYYVQSVEKQRKSKKFIMGSGHEDAWLGSIRSTVLSGARSRFPRLKQEGYLVIKETDGGMGAPLVMRALPESRMILLVRDPRDVVASVLDGIKKGAWLYNWRDEDDGGWSKLAAQDPLAFAKKYAAGYLQQIGNAKEAYDAHEGPKVLVRYEDLRASTLDTMTRIYSNLGISVDQKELARVVENHAWENIPEEQKGDGKFYRKASPGGWREDLTPEQAEVVEHVTAPLLEVFYS